MGCWRWFKGILKKAGIEVTEENREKETDRKVAGRNSLTRLGSKIISAK